MKRVFTLLVSLALVSHFHWAAAQAGAAPKPITPAFELIQQGRFDTAIAVLENQLESPNQTAAQRGRGYALLGYAYKEEGKYEAAQRSFDRALRLMDAANDRSTDYATTLDMYAEALMSKGDLQAAERALQEAAGVEIRMSNHAGLAGIYTHTAELEIQQKKYRQAKEALASARAEAELAKDSGNSLRVEMDSTGGWLATSTGKMDEAVAAYVAALEECRQQYGEKSALTGWSYLLLGRAQGLGNDLTGAARSMDAGLAILKETVGTNNIRYVAGELAYSELLDRAGSHAEAVRVNSAAHESLKSLGIEQCAGCTVGVWSLRHEGAR